MIKMNLGKVVFAPLTALLATVPIEAIPLGAEHGEIGQIGISFDFSATETSRWPGLRASFESTAVGLINDTSLLIVSASEAEEACFPVLEIGLDVLELKGCHGHLVFYIEIALTQKLPPSSRGCDSSGGFESVTLWAKGAWGEAPGSDLGPSIQSSLISSLGLFPMEVGLANVASRQMAAAGVSLPEVESEAETRVDRSSNALLGLSLSAGPDEGSHHWDSERAKFGARARHRLEDEGFTVVRADEAAAKIPSTVRGHLTLVQPGECPGTVVAVLKAELETRVKIENTSHRLLSARKAVPVAKELSFFQASVESIWPEATKRLDAQLDSLLKVADACYK